MLVVDASLVVAALADSAKDGTWALKLLATDQLAAPHLMPVEAARYGLNSRRADYQTQRATKLKSRTWQAIGLYFTPTATGTRFLARDYRRDSTALLDGSNIFE